MLSDMEGNHELIEGLLTAKNAGKVRNLGLAGAENSRQIESLFPGVFQVVQMPESQWDSTSPVPDFTYSVVTGASAAQPKEPNGPDRIRWLLSKALARRPSGGVLISTTKIEHLRTSTEAALGTRV
jgi:hypothetical protein